MISYETIRIKLKKKYIKKHQFLEERKLEIRILQ